MIMKRIIILLGLFVLPAVFANAESASKTTSLRFEVTIARGLVAHPQKGRLFVILNQKVDPEPRLSLDKVGLDAPPILARDVDHFKAAATVAVIDGGSISYPIENLADLPTGDYYVQALFDSNFDQRSLNATGNLFSAVRKVHLDASRGGAVKIELTQMVTPEQMPAETEHLKYVRILSPLLTKFHGRPIYLRAGIILPRDYEREPTLRYPLLIRIGGFGAKFTRVQGLMDEKSDFRKMWLADGTPRMILVHLDGDGPYG